MSAPADHAVVPPAEVSDHLERVLSSVVARKEISHALIAVERGDRSFRWMLRILDCAGSR